MEAEIPTPAPEQPGSMTASIRFTTVEQKRRFMRVFEYRKAKGKSASVSDFIWQLFEYVEKNPYGDFPTGR